MHGSVGYSFANIGHEEAFITVKSDHLIEMVVPLLHLGALVACFGHGQCENIGAAINGHLPELLQLVINGTGFAAAAKIIASALEDNPAVLWAFIAGEVGFETGKVLAPQDSIA